MRWPIPAPGLDNELRAVLASGRWALSSPYNGTGLRERDFARAFAAYTGARHVIPTDHGSSALVIALEALGLDHGSEVLVPALTWVATATAVFRAGMVPVIVDVDTDTGCVTRDTIEAALGPQSRALIVVHWACTMADMPSILQLANERGLDVIEDAAQAHGAIWNGQQAGTFARLGCFSMQHSKVLTSGEGGAVVTNDDTLVLRLEELRADSRSYREEAVRGELELVETATVMGSNFCLGEFAAAVLIGGLSQLDAQHATRNANYARLRSLLADAEGVRFIANSPQQTRLSMYEVPIIFPTPPPASSNHDLARAISAELGMRAYVPRAPLHRSPLLQPQTKRSVGPLAHGYSSAGAGRTFTSAEWLADHAVLLHHSAFLGDHDDMQDIADAVIKVLASLR